MEKYKVNPNAESVIDKLATFILIVGILELCIGIIVAITAGADGSGESAVIALVAGFICFVTTLIAWAILKVFVNISRSLYNIVDVLSVEPKAQVKNMPTGTSKVESSLEKQEEIVNEPELPSLVFEDKTFKVGDKVYYRYADRTMFIKAIKGQEISCAHKNKKGIEEFDGVYGPKDLEIVE